MTFEPPTIHLRYGSGAESSEEARRKLAETRRQTASVPSFAEITAKYPDLAAATSVYAAGSVVLGWGHANSDIDLYVVSEQALEIDEKLEAFTRLVSTEDPVIRIVIAEFGAFRADIELWRECQIDEVIARFSTDTPSQESPELDKSEQDMLYRLSSGSPLHGAAWWEARRDAIHRSGYGLWLAENRKLGSEGYLEDVAGLLASQDAHTAVLAAREAFVTALEAVLAVQGDYSVNRKWLYRRCASVQPEEMSLEDIWTALTMTGAQADPAGWAAQTAEQAQRLLLSVEGRGL
ncbi:MAG TPA: hypothetical protein VE781_15605 [Kineosporiaceae bacterium]|nr:hypothetical protein [Kineosporiaceae bacterium]